MTGYTPYDLPMIRDFLDHLLLELRVQHFENLNAMRALKKTDSFDAAIEAGRSTSEKIIEQYTKRYPCCLLAATGIDSKDATEEEKAAVMQAVLESQLEKRDQQIGHLEALKDLFDEAIRCAALPFGTTKDGKEIQPQVSHNVRDMIDSAFEKNLPIFDELAPSYFGHFVASEEGIESMRGAKVIAATCEQEDLPLVLFGLAEIERIAESGESSEVKMLPIPVEDFRELRFVIAAIWKFVGRPDTDGLPWKDVLPA